VKGRGLWLDQREEKCIEFVLRTIEKRLMKNRSNVWRPEENRDTPSDRRIDAVARIGGQDFALEHTMVEPYEGHYKQGVVTQKARIYLWKQLEKFDLKVGIDIALPNGFSTLYPKQKQREKFIRALASLIREKQSEIESLGDDDRFYEIGVIGEIPIKVVRNGFEKIGEDTRPDLLSMAGDYQKWRPDRIQRSLADKLPKLKRWGKDHQTVLILENRDISLTSWRSVRPVEVVLFFRPVSSQFKTDHGFIQAANLTGSTSLS